MRTAIYTAAILICLQMQALAHRIWPDQVPSDVDLGVHLIAIGGSILFIVWDGHAARRPNG